MKLIGILCLISSCQCLKVRNDIRRVWRVKLNQCRCQTYSFREVKSLDKLIACEDYFAPIREEFVGECKDTDFWKQYPERCAILPNELYCDDLVGFSKDSWAENLTPRGRESKACYEDESKRKCNFKLR